MPLSVPQPPASAAFLPEGSVDAPGEAAGSCPSPFLASVGTGACGTQDGGGGRVCLAPRPAIPSRAGPYGGGGIGTWVGTLWLVSGVLLNLEASLQSGRTPSL